MGLESLISPVGMGISGLTGLMGLIQSANAEQRNKRLVNNQSNLLDKTYLPDMNQRYLDTEQAQSFLSTMRDRIMQNNKQAEQTAAITGGTDEATLAAKDANTRSYGDYLNKLSGYGTQYKQSLQDRYLQGKNQILGLQMGGNAGQSQAGQNLFSNSMSTIGNLAMMPLLGEYGGQRTPQTGLNNALMQPKTIGGFDYMKPNTGQLMPMFNR